MEKQKVYKRVQFSVATLKEASKVLQCRAASTVDKEATYRLYVELDDAGWRHDSLDEFFADYSRCSGYANYTINLDFDYVLELYYFANFDSKTTISVTAPERSAIEAVFSIFETHLDESRIPEQSPPSPSPPATPTIFIGHGNSLLWRDLKDHLQDQHAYDVVAYEIGARAGHEVRDILEDMLNESSFAILVMTGEDKTKDDKLHPRLNVVHELGLFSKVA